jgi:hypothetical protein
MLKHIHSHECISYIPPLHDIPRVNPGDDSCNLLILYLHIDIVNMHETLWFQIYFLGRNYYEQDL